MNTNRPDCPSKEICMQILHTISDNKLQSEIKFALPKTGRKFINIFDLHDQNSSNQFASALAMQLNIKLILLEFPIEMNSAVVSSGIQFRNKEYDKSMQELKKTAHADGIKILCMDKPRKLKKDFRENANVLNFMSNLVKTSDADETWPFDALRNGFMSHFIYYFTEAAIAITINGMAHCRDLISQLTSLDNDANCFIILISVNPNKQNDIEYKTWEINNKTFHCLHVTARDEYSLKSKDLVDQVIKFMYQLKFIENDEIFYQWQRFFKTPESAKAMLPMDCSPTSTPK